MIPAWEPPPRIRRTTRGRSDGRPCDMDARLSRAQVCGDGRAAPPQCVPAPEAARRLANAGEHSAPCALRSPAAGGGSASGATAIQPPAMDEPSALPPPLPHAAARRPALRSQRPEATDGGRIRLWQGTWPVPPCDRPSDPFLPALTIS